MKRKTIYLGVGITTLLAGVYFLFLYMTPHISWMFRSTEPFEPPVLVLTEVGYMTKEEAEAAGYMDIAPVSAPISSPIGGTLYDVENTVVIEAAGIKLAIVESTSAAALEEGSWHRLPQQGDPEQGGNFILTGHRFGFDWTPAGVAQNSAFYHLDKVNEGDTITVYWNNRRYDYMVYEKQRLSPYETWVEDQAEEHRLTVYTCTLGGERDGREVLFAEPMWDMGTE